MGPLWDPGAYFVADSKTRKTLTDKTVAAAKAPPAKRLVIKDAGRGSVPGLELRITPDQSKTWSIRYYREADGKRRRFKLGKYPEMSLEKARTECLEALRAIRAGGDPAHARELRKRADTFKALATEYLNSGKVVKLRSRGEIKRILEREWYPTIGAWKAGEVTRAKIIEVVDAIDDRGAPVSANRALAVVRQVYRWALSKAKLETVPVTGVVPPGDETPRKRALDADEIKQLWDRLPAAVMTEDTKDAIRLALILGQRVGEITGMRREEVDIDEAVWILPEERVKNGVAHSVPLPEMALSIIRPRLKSKAKFVFPGRSEKAPLVATAPNRAVQRNLKQLGLTAFTIHDLRRSVNTHMARLGISSEIRARLLNHVSGKRASVTESVYNVHAYDEEKRRALAIWAAELERIVGAGPAADNVVKIGRPA